MTTTTWLWLGFNAFVLALLALDLGVFHRKSHTVGFKEALGWTVAWITLALCFNAGVWHFAGGPKALEFLTGYVIEYSLSADNVFVFAMLFSYFAVPAHYQHKVLFWGILGALVMRLGMILLGTALITKFAWIIYVFGAFLIFTGIKMLLKSDEEIHPERNPLVRLFKRFMPVTPEFRGDRFFVRENGVLLATPLFVVLLMVEFTDVIFAVDSIPAIYGLTEQAYIVFTANAFALMGLRQLYFLIGGLLERLIYLAQGLAVILAFIGVKLLLHAMHVNELPFINGGEPMLWAPEIPIWFSLLFIGATVTVATIASLVVTHRRGRLAPPDADAIASAEDTAPADAPKR